MVEVRLKDGSDIWVPPGTVETMVDPFLGHNVETGKQIGALHAVVKYTAPSGREYRRRTVVMLDEAVSQAQAEDLMAHAAENTLRDIKDEEQRKVGKHTPSPAERRELGATMRDILASRQKRAESSNNKVYY